MSASVTEIVCLGMCVSVTDSMTVSMFVSVFVGTYASMDEANATLASWPASMKANKPMVRTWTKIRQDQPS